MGRPNAVVETPFDGTNILMDVLMQSRLTVRMTMDERIRLDRLSEATGMTPSEITRAALAPVLVWGFDGMVSKVQAAIEREDTKI